jgi:hypothetical protein
MAVAMAGVVYTADAISGGGIQKKCREEREESGS